MRENLATFPELFHRVSENDRELNGEKDGSAPSTISNKTLSSVKRFRKRFISNLLWCLCLSEFATNYNC